MDFRRAAALKCRAAQACKPRPHDQKTSCRQTFPRSERSPSNDAAAVPREIHCCFALRESVLAAPPGRQARGDSAPRCAAERCADSSTKGSLKLALPLVSRGRQLGAASNFDRRTRGGGCVVYFSVRQASVYIERLARVRPLCLVAVTVKGNHSTKRKLSSRRRNCHLKLKYCHSWSPSRQLGHPRSVL